LGARFGAGLGARFGADFADFTESFLGADLAFVTMGLGLWVNNRH
jgi:hypothetical protein